MDQTGCYGNQVHNVVCISERLFLKLRFEALRSTLVTFLQENDFFCSTKHPSLGKKQKKRTFFHLEPTGSSCPSPFRGNRETKLRSLDGRSRPDGASKHGHQEVREELSSADLMRQRDLLPSGGRILQRDIEGNI